ncbi:hypothetical protein PVAND_011646 [Polypedilum vanderplanki]|uniref:Uncharacterized protein n=1 Tax=Polypedilum vanderplanki TaxID=319348 RepID=A0A9J6CL18_POLVA|nr:hypothetical protein PVAND_011646 [Polypedilum vanderplanki]
MKIKFKNGSITKKDPLHKKIKRIQVIRTVMDTEKSKQSNQQTQQDNSTGTSTSGTGKSDELQDEFINTGRIGRRNALPDILDSHCETSTADLPMKLSALTTNDSASSSNCQTNETSNQTNNK